MAATEFTPILNILGGAKITGTKEVSSLLDLMNMADKGLPLESLRATAERVSLSENTTREALRIRKRTYERRKSQGRLPADETERLINLARVVATGLEVFGSASKTKTWLTSESRALGARPLDLVGSSIGVEVILAELTRIEHGVFA